MVRAWLMHVERPGFGWSVSCVSDVRHAEAVIAGLERRETRHEGTRLEVELELADGARHREQPRCPRRPLGRRGGGKPVTRGCITSSSDTRPPWPYTPGVALSADSPVSLVLAARTLPETRAEALAELRRRLTLAGPSCASPGALSAAVGIGERTLRRVLDELDAEGPAVPVGWTRSRGGGMVRARAGRARKIAANPRT